MNGIEINTNYLERLSFGKLLQTRQTKDSVSYLSLFPKKHTYSFSHFLAITKLPANSPIKFSSIKIKLHEAKCTKHLLYLISRRDDWLANHPHPLQDKAANSCCILFVITIIPRQTLANDKHGRGM